MALFCNILFSESVPFGFVLNFLLVNDYWCYRIRLRNLYPYKILTEDQNCKITGFAVWQ